MIFDWLIKPLSETKAFVTTTSTNQKRYQIKLTLGHPKGFNTAIWMDWPEHKALMEWTEAKKFYKWFFGKPNNSYYVFDAHRRKTMIRRVDITGFTLELVEKKDETN